MEKRLRRRKRKEKHVTFFYQNHDKKIFDLQKNLLELLIEEITNKKSDFVKINDAKIEANLGVETKAMTNEYK